jgi:hypothetical protein
MNDAVQVIPPSERVKRTQVDTRSRDRSRSPVYRTIIVQPERGRVSTRDRSRSPESPPIIIPAPFPYGSSSPHPERGRLRTRDRSRSPVYRTIIVQPEHGRVSTRDRLRSPESPPIIIPAPFPHESSSPHPERGRAHPTIIPPSERGKDRGERTRDWSVTATRNRSVSPPPSPPVIVVSRTEDLPSASSSRTSRSSPNVQSAGPPIGIFVESPSAVPRRAPRTSSSQLQAVEVEAAPTTRRRQESYTTPTQPLVNLVLRLCLTIL